MVSNSKVIGEFLGTFTHFGSILPAVMAVEAILDCANVVGGVVGDAGVIVFLVQNRLDEIYTF